MLHAFVRRNVQEIRDDPALRIHGALLGVTHLLTLLFWLIRRPLDEILLARVPICWPFWESCHEHRVLDARGVLALECVYFFVSFVSIVLFAQKRTVHAAWWVLLATNALKLAIVVQDYQLRLNQHYMAGLATLVFLFFPGKRDLCRLAVVGFYFAAGLVKLDHEWLSGAALVGELWLFRGAALPWACAYVVVLELAIVWGLLARHRWVFWPALAQIVVFQLFSWPIVGFFYPTLMYCLLALFVLVRFVPAPGASAATDPAPHPVVALARRRAPRSTYAYVVGFALLQVVPLLFPGDSALTGEGRMFAIHMFDALAVCKAYAMVHLPGRERRPVRVLGREVARIRCDPIVVWNRAKALCRTRHRGARPFEDLDLYLDARRRSERAFSRIIAYRSFCTRTPSYDLWRHNAWILPTGS
ncbi:MAG: hypothetical protein IT379_20600 [Deltaproteobacteria bacterium]|nr:hypothetical protein [Deltaproteobacteria bacterium]